MSGTQKNALSILGQMRLVQDQPRHGGGGDTQSHLNHADKQYAKKKWPSSVLLGWVGCNQTIATPSSPFCGKGMCVYLQSDN